MAKNVATPKSMNKPASDSDPAGMMKMDPAPGGGMVRNISGPKINRENKGGNKTNNTGMDGGTSVESP